MKMKNKLIEVSKMDREYNVMEEVKEIINNKFKGNKDVHGKKEKMMSNEKIMGENNENINLDGFRLYNKLVNKSPDKNNLLKSVSNNKSNNQHNNFYKSFNKLILLPIFVILISILFIQSISAIGITPGRTTLNFEPGKQVEVPFSVVNTEHKDMSVVFSIRGELGNYITINQGFAEFSASDESKSFIYTFKTPSSLSKPGLHEAEIVAMELPKDIKEQGALIGATVAVVTQLHVYVPYPDKYLEIDVNAVESEGEQKTVFLVPVVNRGKLNVVNARATIDIYTALNEKIITLETDSKPVNSLERAELSAVLDTASVNPGRYLAKVTVIYDNEISELEKEFNIGGQVMEIQEINVKDFELGGIAKFDALIESKSSSDLKDVFLNIIVYNEEGEIMADFKSQNYDVKPLSKVDMTAFWDTAGVKEGTYDGKLILKFGEKSQERNIQLKITDFGIEISGFTGQVTVKRSSGFNMNNLLVIVLIFLVVANIVWFVVVKKILKKKH